MKSPLILLLLVLSTSGVFAKESERVQGEDGVTLVRDFYDDGTMKLLTRLNPDGSLQAKLYYAPGGIPLHIDFYDEEKHVRQIDWFKSDGTPLRRDDFDEKGNVSFARTYTYEGRASNDDNLKRIHMAFVLPKIQIGFDTDPVWHVLVIQPRLPVATVGFQIKNPTDEDGPDSTNLGVLLFDTSTEEGKKAFEDAINKDSNGSVEKTKSGEWEQWAFSAKQDHGKVAKGGDPSKWKDAQYPEGQEPPEYRIIKTFKKTENMTVMILLAWPRLAKNPPDYDKKMGQVLDTLRNSTAVEEKLKQSPLAEPEPTPTPAKKK